MSSRQEQKLQARAERLAREAKLRADQRRRRRLRAGAAAMVALALGGTVVVLAGSGQARMGRAWSDQPRLASLASLGTLRAPGPPGPLGPEGIPIPDAANLAKPGAGAGAGPVDGIQCLGSEQLVFHIHAHLTVYVDGQARRIPYGIGIRGAQTMQTPAGPFVAGGSCFYWLHTHAADGIIHIESPVQRTFTLGDFFDVWGETLTPHRLGPIAGRVITIYNGRVYRGSPRDVPLTAHAQIELEIGPRLLAPETVTFPPGL